MLSVLGFTKEANMNFKHTVYEIIKEDITELKEKARELTIKELAIHYGVSYGKMATILRLSDIKARKPERPKLPLRAKKNENKKTKKDHSITRWALSYNNGRVRYVYYDMLRRCYKPEDRAYYRYGRRGITVCDEWRKDCCNFYKWAKDNGYKPGLQLDRIDNDKGYSPDNCHWVTPRDNMINRRCTRWIEYNGERHTLKEWAEITGIDYQVLADRIYRYGWNAERALTTETKHYWIHSNKKE